jgi:hypothetical protein
MADVDRLVEFAEPLLARPSSPRLAAALEQLPKRGLWVLARENGQPFDHRVDLYLPVRTLYKRAAVVRTRSPLHGPAHLRVGDGGGRRAAAGPEGAHGALENRDHDALHRRERRPESAAIASAFAVSDVRDGSGVAARKHETR